MKPLVFLSALYISMALSHQALAMAPLCADSFATPSSESMMDTSGFIDLYGARQRDIEPAQPTPLSLESLQGLTKMGRNSVRKGQWPQETIDRFQDMSRLSYQELSQLSLPQRIEIFKAHGQWNLLLPTRFSNLLQRSLMSELGNWRESDFYNFALFRKVSPQPLTRAFVNSYQRELLRRFQSWKTNTQLEVLGAEIFHNTTLTTAQMNRLFSELIRSMDNETRTLRLKPVKEFYRALIYLRATQPTAFFDTIVRLEQRLEDQLQRQGLSLEQGGTSGALNPNRPLGPSFHTLVRRIDELFPQNEKIYEAADSRVLGFYDPVDLYYPNLRLIVEWDGPIHYFRRINNQSQLDPSFFRLRPMDTIKDASLNRMGIAVLRWPPHLNPIVRTVDINALISLQNPGLWDQ